MRTARGDGVIMASRPDNGGRIGRWLPVGALMGVAAVVLATVPARGVGGAQAEGAVKAVVHVNFAQSTHQAQGLKNVENILKTAADQGITAEIEVVCHADGIRLVHRVQTELATEVASLTAQGVRFVACQNTMRQRSMTEADLLPNVGMVPSGAFEVVRKQQDGFAYFKP
jgi:uncharacterized protein